MKTELEAVTPTFAQLRVNAHGYDSPYMVKAFIEDVEGRPVCGLYEGDGPHARLFAAAPAMYDALQYVGEVAESISTRAADDSDPAIITVTVGWLREVKDALALVDGPRDEEAK
jgi:hypothetical protein